MLIHNTSSKYLGDAVEGAVHFIDFLEFWDVLDDDVDLAFLHDFAEFGVGGEQHVFAIELADVGKVNHEFLLVFVGGLDNVITLSDEVLLEVQSLLEFVLCSGLLLLVDVDISAGVFGEARVVEVQHNDILVVDEVEDGVEMHTLLVPVLVVPHHTEIPGPEQVVVHQVFGALDGRTDADLHHGEVLAHRDEVTALNVAA